MSEERSAATGAIAALEVKSAWTRRHVLDLDDFSRAEIEAVMETTGAMKEVLGREVPRVPALRGKTIVTLFYEASTRTRASFELAAKALGADVINIAASGSSVQKGESLYDTVRTLQAVGAQMLVMRHGSSGAPYLVARHVEMNVVNGGDGWHAHPTQGLLDIYTMRSHLGDLRGKRVVIVGDIAHSRVARSNIWGLTNLGADVVVCAPPSSVVALKVPAMSPAQSAGAMIRTLARSTPSRSAVTVPSAFATSAIGVSPASSVANDSEPDLDTRMKKPATRQPVPT